MQLIIQVSTGKEYLFLASNLRTAVWSWKLTVLEYNSKSCWETENSCVGLEINSAGIQQLTPAEKLRTAERGWKITVLRIQQLSTTEIQKQYCTVVYQAVYTTFKVSLERILASLEGWTPWVGYSIKNMYLRVFSTLLGPSWLDVQHVRCECFPLLSPLDLFASILIYIFIPVRCHKCRGFGHVRADETRPGCAPPRKASGRSSKGSDSE